MNGFGVIQRPARGGMRAGQSIRHPYSPFPSLPFPSLPPRARRAAACRCTASGAAPRPPGVVPGTRAYAQGRAPRACRNIVIAPALPLGMAAAQDEFDAGAILRELYEGVPYVKKVAYSVDEDSRRILVMVLFDEAGSDDDYRVRVMTSMGKIIEFKHRMPDAYHVVPVSIPPTTATMNTSDA